MTDFRTMYDRDYIGHFDLPGGNDLTLTIKKVIGGELTAVGGRKSKKPIVHFQEAVKPLICNKTNGKTIAGMYGNAVEAWKGKRITLCVATTRDPSSGGDIECIRIRPKVPSGNAQQNLEQPPEPEEFVQETGGKGTAAPDATRTLDASTSTDAPVAAASSSSGFISAEQIREIETLCELKELKGRLSAKLAASKIASIDKIPASKFDAILAWADKA